MPPVTKPFAAHLLPAREPTLAQLADRLVAASQLMRTCNDADWSDAYDAFREAQQAFRDALEVATGITLVALELAMGEV
jgi:hypothetical protein